MIDALHSNLFCPQEPGLFIAMAQSLLDSGDKYCHLADMPSYIRVQDTVSTEFRHPSIWARKAIHNVARIGKFSSDRTVSEYARDIWHLQRV